MGLCIVLCAFGVVIGVMLKTNPAVPARQDCCGRFRWSGMPSRRGWMRAVPDCASCAGWRHRAKRADRSLRCGRRSLAYCAPCRDTGKTPSVDRRAPVPRGCETIRLPVHRSFPAISPIGRPVCS